MTSLLSRLSSSIIIYCPLYLGSLIASYYFPLIKNRSKNISQNHTQKAYVGIIPYKSRTPETSRSASRNFPVLLFLTLIAATFKDTLYEHISLNPSTCTRWKVDYGPHYHWIDKFCRCFHPNGIQMLVTTPQYQSHSQEENQPHSNPN